jgi:RNA polymerase sigma-70 factor (ECF subfamily)
MTGDAHRAEDLKQDTFVRLFEKRQQYRPQARFSTYLWRIALNLCYDELRRLQRRGECSLEDETGEPGSWLNEAISQEPPPDASLVDAEQAAQVREALMALPEIYRTVLVLRHYENLKLREIAEVLEIPEGTVNSRMAEALSQLTRLLAAQGSKNNKPKLCAISIL